MLKVVPTRPNSLLPQGFWAESLDLGQNSRAPPPRATNSRRSLPASKDGGADGGAALGDEEDSAAP